MTIKSAFQESVRGFAWIGAWVCLQAAVQWNDDRVARRVAQAPAPLLVQYALEDSLFTPKGMKDAHKILEYHYRNVGHPEAYTGQFYPGSHRFDLEMQQEAFQWLKQQLISDGV